MGSKMFTTMPKQYCRYFVLPMDILSLFVLMDTMQYQDGTVQTPQEMPRVPRRGSDWHCTDTRRRSWQSQRQRHRWSTHLSRDRIHHLVGALQHTHYLFSFCLANVIPGQSSSNYRSIVPVCSCCGGYWITLYTVLKSQVSDTVDFAMKTPTFVITVYLHYRCSDSYHP